MLNLKANQTFAIFQRLKYMFNVNIVVMFKVFIILIIYYNKILNINDYESLESGQSGLSSQAHI